MRSFFTLLPILFCVNLVGAADGTGAPSTEVVLQAMKARQEVQEPLKERFLYTETVRMKVFMDGKVEEDKTDAYEVVRIGQRTLRRQTLKAGKPLSEKEATKQDSKLQKAAEQAEKEGPGNSLKKLKIRDITEVCEFDPVRLEGDELLLAFHPRKNFKAKSKEEEWASKLSGSMRVDARTYDLLEVKGRTEGKISVLLGIGALNEGAEFQMTLGRHEGGVMLPQSVHFKGKARMFWKQVDLEMETAYSDFKATGMEASEISDVQVLEKSEFEAAGSSH